MLCLVKIELSLVVIRVVVVVELVAMAMTVEGETVVAGELVESNYNR